jgi:hypothetical protein
MPKTYKSGEVVAKSGIYDVIHDKEHRQTHEVTCVKGERFPPCKNCGSGAQFILKTEAIHAKEHPSLQKKKV